MRKRKSLAERFWSKVSKGAENECWIWRGATDEGYGALARGGRFGGMIRAHVASWIIHFGAVPKGKCVLHNCPSGDKRTCVNPKHLWLGTRADNCRDMAAKGRGAKGERHGSAKLTGQIVNLIRSIYNGGAVTQRKLASRFGIHQVTVSTIVRNKVWRHL